MLKNERAISISKKAFTLIELLVVIAIIGVIATLSVIALNNARAKSRDAKRMTDVKQMQTALELYFNDMGRYPETLGTSIFSTTTNSTTTYMAIVPSAPTPADGGCSAANNNYTYYSKNNGSSYGIEFCLGGNISAVSSGLDCATESGVLTSDCCSSFPVAYEGGPYDANGISTTTGGYYRTVKVGDQCWLRDNLNVGIKVLRAADQSDNSIIEKYCYNENIINPNPGFSGACGEGAETACGGCDTDGGLYQWDEAMGYVETESAQGVCPSGWHIPSDGEWYALENYLTDAGQACLATRSDASSCSAAGTKLRLGSSSNMDILLVGDRNTIGFYFQGVAGNYAWLWSSSLNESNPSQAWKRVFIVNDPLVDRGPIARYHGFSIRCVKD